MKSQSKKGRSSEPSNFSRIPLELLFAVALIVSFWLPRLDLLHKVNLTSPVLSPASFLNLLVFDLTVLGYFLAPWLALSLITGLFLKKTPKWFRWALFSYLTFALFLSFFMGIAEFFFIDEFSARYNFIAVDYLVYTSEVLNNIWESYPVLPVVVGLLSLSLGLTWILMKTPRRISWFGRALALGLFAILFVMVNENARLDSLTESQKELAKNDFHTLFAAFRNNQINFEKFYSTLPSEQAINTVHQQLDRDFDSKELNKTGDEVNQLLVTNLRSPVTAKKYNIVLVLMESMSARYLKPFGGKGLTPNLDRLFETGLTFDHTYATGTRTVRGIEAVLLSLPPTPGQSIVRRPHSENLFSLGSVLKDQGYDLSFVYGGHAFFDNMRDFYETNGFKVLDQGEFSSQQKHFANAWGICDEDVFDYALGEANKESGKPFFQFILTTSNHRPYTFPEGRIDMPSGVGGRDAAVKYSDYSIGRYLEQASHQPWFDQTLFVFVADHDAAVAGGTKILPSDYRIPFIVYAPKILKPQKISLMASQMDVAPTLLGILGLSYQSRFFGHDLRRARTERAFLGTYQKLAYMENGRMTILSPPKKWQEYSLNGETPTLLKAGRGSEGVDDFIKTAISYYESASDSFKQRRIGLENRFSNAINVRDLDRN